MMNVQICSIYVRHTNENVPEDPCKIDNSKNNEHQLQCFQEEHGENHSSDLVVILIFVVSLFWILLYYFFHFFRMVFNHCTHHKSNVYDLEPFKNSANFNQKHQFLVATHVNQLNWQNWN